MPQRAPSDRQIDAAVDAMLRYLGTIPSAGARARSRELARVAVIAALNSSDEEWSQPGRLRDALLWIDKTDPEIVAAAERKFGFRLVETKTV